MQLDCGICRHLILKFHQEFDRVGLNFLRFDQIPREDDRNLQDLEAHQVMDQTI